MSTDKNDWEYQGKRKSQVEFSEMMVAGSMVVMIVLIIVSWIWKVIN